MTDKDRIAHKNSVNSVEPSLDISIFHIQVGYLEGKILTIVDASFGDREQRDAVKSLVKKMFRDQRNHVDSIVYGVPVGSVGELNGEQIK